MHLKKVLHIINGLWGITIVLFLMTSIWVHFAWFAMGNACVMIWFNCRYWRCPHCDKWLGSDVPSYCRHCGKQLD